MGCGCSPSETQDGAAKANPTYLSVLIDDQPERFELIRYSGMTYSHVVTSPTGTLKVLGVRDYGMRRGGDEFLVLSEDIDHSPQKFSVVPTEPVVEEVSMDQVEAQENDEDYSPYDGMTLKELRFEIADYGLGIKSNKKQVLIDALKEHNKSISFDSIKGQS